MDKPFNRLALSTPDPETAIHCQPHRNGTEIETRRHAPVYGDFSLAISTTRIQAGVIEIRRRDVALELVDVLPHQENGGNMGIHPFGSDAAESVARGQSADDVVLFHL